MKIGQHKLHLHELRGNVADVWFVNEELLVEDCAVRARITAIRIQSGKLDADFVPFGIWADRSRVWCFHVRRNIFRGGRLSVPLISGPEVHHACNRLLPSNAVELVLTKGRRVVFYGNKTIPPSNPSQFLLEEERLAVLLLQ